jgi:hypothetical protein
MDGFIFPERELSGIDSQGRLFYAWDEQEGYEVAAITIKRTATAKTLMAKKRVTGKPPSAEKSAAAKKPGAGTKKASKKVDILELFVRTYSSF